MADKTQKHKETGFSEHAASEALRKSEAKYRCLFENSRDAILTVDAASTRFTSGNPAALKLFGAANLDEFISHGPLGLSPERQPDGRLSAEKGREMIATTIRAGSHSFEWTHRRLNGEEFFADVLLTLIDQGGKATIMSTVRDITDRKQAEKALAASEERYRQLFELESDAILLVDRETGRFVDASPSALRLYGYTRQEFLALKPSDVSAEPEKTSHAIADGETFVAVRKHRKKDGAIFPVEIRGNYFDSNGRKMHVAAVRDLTDQEQAEQALRKSEADLNRAQAIAHVGSWSWECQSDVLSWSQEMYRIFGVSPESVEHTARGLERLIHPDDVPKYLASRETIARGQAFEPFEHRVIRPDGEIRVVQIYAAEIERNSAGQPTRLFGAVQDITERKRAETVLRESDEKFSKAFHSSPIGMTLSTQKEGRYLEVNAVFLDLLQRSREEVIGHTAVELGVWGGPTQRDKFLSKLNTGGKKKNIEVSWRTKSGQTRVVVMSGVEIVIGGTECLLGTVLDITERKQAEQALRVREEQLRLYAEHSPVAVAMLDRNMKYVVVSRRWIEDFRLGDQPLVGRSHYEVFPEIPPRWVEIHKRCLAGAVEKCDEEEFPRADGKTDWIRWEIRPWHQDDNSIGGIIIFSEDITERKRIADSHARLATVVEQAAETIMITDTRGTILYANPAFEKTTGYTRAEAIGQNPRILKTGKQNDEFYRRMWQTLERGEVWQGHFINRRKDGTLYEEEATISPVRDLSGKIVSYAAVKRDVTREVQLEKQFLQAQKMESVGQLAGGVAHDFNNMLAATMMHLGILEENRKFDPETQETIRELLEEAKRAANLTRQLLMFSRRSVMEVKLLDINALLTSLLKMLGRLIGEHIVVRFDRREGLPAIEADPGMIEQVIMNLAVNARDAMPGGGKLTIEIEALQVDAERVAAKPEVRPGRFLCLSVSDTGCGMDEATRDRIFEPFFTTKETGKGTGLGLATVHGIVTQHKGWVEVESEVGKGTTFRIFLPASTKKMEEAVQVAKAAALRGHETILLVEDEPNVRSLVALTLRKLGYAVFAAENGQAAVDLWDQRRGEFDLLFTDMMMPEGLTGLDLAEMLKKRQNGLKVIISSGYSAEITGQSRLDAHGIAYLQKPYSVEALAKVVRDCLDGRN